MIEAPHRVKSSSSCSDSFPGRSDLLLLVNRNPLPLVHQVIKMIAKRLSVALLLRFPHFSHARLSSPIGNEISPTPAGWMVPFLRARKIEVDKYLLDKLQQLKVKEEATPLLLRTRDIGREVFDDGANQLRRLRQLGQDFCVGSTVTR
jgi:hypothetical protein